ncbi:hypothetical protein M0R45_006411 [Rubus argutus]|uniref:Peptidase metallopeptidase domain-containing protein n=1 Tax=Rubus argutus TaxID=59490 RepID=A0AAW1YR11_RUBAR
MASKSYLSLFTITLLLGGNNIKGINDLKKYLKKFGYLNYKYHNNSNDDDFDDLLEEAIKTYQLNYNLKSTGTLDGNTISKMMIPRCGVPDIINGISSMNSAKKMHHYGSIHTTAHYSFFNGNPKWPSSKYHLTYGFLPGTLSNVTGPIAQAFATWAGKTHFKFSQQSYEYADLKISFQRGDHGDGNPFDGPGGILAHAFSPTDGRLHFDKDESWSMGANPGSYDLETVALHEIGHLLGLGHSSVEGAVMFPSISTGVVTRSLNEDDVQGIKALYNGGSYHVPDYSTHMYCKF